ncbi:PAH-inducible cytochrome P450 monooxygenase PC-PAH 1 [Armillaria gallica]|uniref:PAH-inducible cytochrome P450 monooxygenase PC-PAH 1 n=1 Tax=Armillaria gallica TaxID=47427 RepID=A0A2H3EN97_ARMGA|nr:PAH-inducible cytochrome P450 monooxygenase PC-PAH 1 [Armillaria gallica]
MRPALYYLIIPAIAYLFVAVPLRLWKRRYTIRKIRGPPRPSFLLGHEHLLRSRQHIGDLEMEWYQQYGAVYRTGGCFGQDILFVADPKALQYIFHSSGYRFTKTRDSRFITDAAMGQGIGTVDGSVHQRQRKILGPAFATSQLRLFLKVFQTSALKLIEKTNEDVGEGKEVNVLQWTRKLSLDIIGITSFRYKFDSINDGQTELMVALDNIGSGEAQMWPKKWELLFIALWRILPEWVLFLLEWLPSRAAMPLKRFRDVATKVSRLIFEKQLIEVANDPNPSEKDIVNVLVMSHLANDAKKKMSDPEIDSQLAAFILAGRNTTAGVLAWLLYDLSRHPEIQTKVREEISTAKSNAPRALTWDDYDAMVWLNAVIKEVLRYHPLVYGLLREASQDDVLPLAEPIITSDGQSCSEIPISKGQVIFASVYTYNRLPLVWGHDAAEWNPRRFLEDREMKQESLGAYANLMTFSGGIRGCLGWRFAVMEMQSVVTELLSNFEFSIPKGAPELQHGPVDSTALIPIVLGKADEGPQVPLLVTPLNKQNRHTIPPMEAAYNPSTISAGLIPDNNTKS